MSKIKCPECKIERRGLRWIYLKDWIGNKVKCSNCKRIFQWKHIKFPILNKGIWDFLFRTVIAIVIVGFALIVSISIQFSFDLPNLFGKSIFGITVLALFYWVIDFLTPFLINKWFVLEEVKKEDN